MPVCVLLRLAWSRLLKSYAAFGVMLGVGLCRDVALLIPRYSTHTYTVLWEATLPLLLAAQIAAAVSLYRAIAGLYPRIGRFGFALFASALALTALGCLLLLPAELGRMTPAEALLRSAFLLQRWIASEIAGGLLLAVFVLSACPRPLKRLPRNLVVHTALLTTYFTLTAALMLCENLAPLGAQAVLEQIEFAGVIGLYLAWTCSFSRAGERSEQWETIDTRALIAAHERELMTRELYAGLAK